MASIARITQIVEPEAQALGFDLVRVIVFGKSEVGDEEVTLQIMAERPDTGQLVIEDCAALSRRVSAALATLANIFQPHSSNQLGLDVALLTIDAAMDAMTTLPLGAPDVR